MGKPKQNSSIAQNDILKTKAPPGKAVRYIGILGKKFTCPSCGRSGSRMLIWEHGEKAYCSRRCIEI